MTAVELILLLNAVERGEGKRIPLTRYQRWFLTQLARKGFGDDGIFTDVLLPYYDEEKTVALITRLRRMQHWKE